MDRIVKNIMALKQEEDRLKERLRGCELQLASATRSLGAAKAVVTKFESRPTCDGEKLRSAQSQKDSAQEEYNRLNNEYYKIIKEIGENNVKLQLEEKERVNMDSPRTLRR